MKTLILSGVLLLSCSPAFAEHNATSHHFHAAELARPVKRHGLPNCYKVSEQLYRSSQPTADGMRSAEQLGVRTVVDLRWGQSDRDRVAGTALAYVHIPMHPTHIKNKDVVEFLRIVTDKHRTPVLVHCHAGADRTGLMTAVYRVIVQGWSKRDAIEELERGGYHFHSEFENIPRYINAMNVETLRREAGID